jgi:hypothetical protein
VRMRIPHRGLIGGLAGVSIATALSLLLTVAAPADPPSLTLTATDAAVGQPIHATAELAETPNASGDISFEVFGPGDSACTGPALTPAPASASVTGEGQYASGEITPPTAGTYYWSAHYSGDPGGDPENPPADSTCSAISSVGKASPVLTGSASDGTVGTAIHDEVTVTGGFSTTGEVTFSVYSPTDTGCATPLATTAVPLQGDHATSANFVAQQAGEFLWTVEYEGDANNDAALLGCGATNQASIVSKASPTLTGTATSAVKVGLTITDSVTLAESFGASGQLVFRAYGPSNQTCAAPPKYQAAVPVSGNGSYSPPGFAPAPGLYRWTVEYEGDTNNDSTLLGCGATNQASTVNKASPTLAGTATSAVKVGLTITDNVALAEGFEADGQLVFRAYGPGDQTCVTTPKYQAAVPVSGNGTYAPPGFAPAPGLYRWTVEYEGDTNNDAALLGCGATNQASAVGTIPVTVAIGATGGTVGNPVNATATIQEGAIPTGQITFKAFSPGDANCSGAAAFSSTVGVSGNGQYRSTAFVPSRVGTFRWTAAYSGDVNHIPTTTECGKATSGVAQAGPSIAGAVQQRATVGTPFQDAATLQGGYSPGGTITFQIYGPVASGCAKPAFVDTIAIAGNGTFSSDPFVAQRPGRYSFVASYSGDSANRKATEPCDSASQVVVVEKRMPKVKPRALLKGSRRIAIRARLSGGFSPSGTITFRLYGPGDKRCRHKPAFSGGFTVKSNGNIPLAQYLATKSGIYRLSVGYSGDLRNRRLKGSCSGAQSIRVS